MDVNGLNSNYSIHIHNFSLIAIRSYILEVKKYPLVYNGNTRIPVSKALIDYAWTRIVAALLDTSFNFETAQSKGYWDRSFRELWKWMRSVLKTDMLLRRSKVSHSRSPEFNWVEYLRFLEPYIQLSNSSNEGVIDSQLDPNVHIQIQAPGDILTIDARNPTVIWLRDSSEDANNQGLYISICLRISADASVDFNRDLSRFTDLFQQIENDNTHISFPQDTVDFFDGVQFSSSTASQNEEAKKYVVQDDILPVKTATISTLVDEDFEYVMSFLPALQQMETKKNAEVKVLMIQALEEVL